MSVYVINPSRVRKNGKKSAPSSKKKAERKHCQSRSEERFGVKFNREVRESAVRAIQSGKGIFVEKQSNRVSLWRGVVPDHEEIVVVYDKLRKEIVTVLRKEWVQ